MIKLAVTLFIACLEKLFSRTAEPQTSSNLEPSDSDAFRESHQESRVKAISMLSTTMTISAPACVSFVEKSFIGVCLDSRKMEWLLWVTSSLSEVYHPSGWFRPIAAGRNYCSTQYGIVRLGRLSVRLLNQSSDSPSTLIANLRRTNPSGM